MLRILLVTLVISVSACSGKKVREPEPDVNICLIDVASKELLCVENFGERTRNVFPLDQADNWVCVDPTDKGEIEYHHRRLHRILDQ